ncbi:uncharacterized protein DUF4350 [Motilibacter rhizosphaerae]|uniref:Uncharacterized protein DUF4350 n=1 Tax=Motilibacter rhizosphaerae TaxID=598652 RepID=A0A4Q7NSM5_9ACTN|nr:DUF4350 domain-containing protein [Motilibacter rhizosphaerae]RZS90143.1 uncharacterized protein DUF4350 [Motilibacter rhizosphaerae]
MSARRPVRRRAAAAAVVLLVVLTGAAVALTASGARAGYLDPRAADSSGSLALARLLGRQGVAVTLVRTAAEAGRAPAGMTLLVTEPAALVDAQVRALAGSGADLVLVAPDEPQLRVLAPELRPVGTAGRGRRDPGCGLPAAQRAGRVRLPGTAYSSGPGALTCYPAGGGALLVDDQVGSRRVTVLGSPRPLQNGTLGEEGSAALALGLLGAHPGLAWYLPSPDDVPAESRRTLVSLLPAGLRYGVAQLLVAALVAALWRARRLGRVVPEPLPVVVPAAEAVEGRGRLYLRARARDRAVDALRGAAAERLRRALGLPAGTPPEQLVTAVARASGRPPGSVGPLLYGAAPADDPALTRSAAALDALEEEVRRT